MEGSGNLRCLDERTNRCEMTHLFNFVLATEMPIHDLASSSESSPLDARRQSILRVLPSRFEVGLLDPPRA